MPVSLWASDAANEKLPPNPYGCTVCHGAATVTPTEVPAGAILPITKLGVEWASQGPEENRIWSELALANVDGDGCSNGFELGDPSGTWLPDSEPRPDLSVHDPNVHDCTLPISDESWSRLKSLFDDN